MCSAIGLEYSSGNCSEITLILMPVNCSQRGPENRRGSWDCRAASHVTFKVVPLYLRASCTARSAEVAPAAPGAGVAWTTTVCCTTFSTDFSTTTVLAFSTTCVTTFSTT